MSSDYYHLLDANIWKEIADRKIQLNGYVYARRKLVINTKLNYSLRKQNDQKLKAVFGH